jgi:autotransporter adhesin
VNHIYRLIWNTTLACWVVASEHTRGRGKGRSSARSVVAAAVLVLSLPAGATDALSATGEDAVEVREGHPDGVSSSASLMVQREPVTLFNELPRGGATNVAPLALHYQSAMVNDAYYANATLSGENSMVLGSRARVTGNRTTGIGNEVLISGGGHTALGSKAMATGGIDAVAIGINATTDGTGHVAIGEAARADTKGAGVHAVAIGARARAGSQGWTGATAVGGEAVATYNGVALGYKTSAQHVGAMALGFNSTAGNPYASAIGYQALASGGSSVALGTLANSAAGGSVAVGDRAKVDGSASSSLALGHSAAVYSGATNAVALGSGSVATAANTVSVGSASLKRRIVNVADGALSATSTDAVTGKQLFAVNQRFNGQSLGLGENAQTLGGRAIAIGYNSQVTTNGGVDGIAIGSNARGGSAGYSGGVAVGGGATSDYNGLAVGYYAKASAGGAVALGASSIADVGNTVSVGNATLKRKIVNVADGALLATSNEAVTGKQLFATNQSVTTATNTADTAKTTADAARLDANAALDKATVVSGLIGQVSATGSIRVGGENTGTVLDVRNKGNAGRTISGVADGALSANSTDAVSGKQLFDTNLRVTTATNTANTAKATADAARLDANAALDKATVVSGLIGQVSATGSIRVGGENTGAVLDVRNKGNADRTISGVAEGALSASSTDAVSGKQLFDTNLRVTTATTTANAAKATADAAQIDAADALGKASLLNGLVSQAAPNGSMRLGAENTGFIVDMRNSNGGTRTLSGVAPGAINGSSSEAVNGAQLNAVNDRVGVHTAAIAGNRMEIGVNREGLDELREAFDNFEPDLTGVVKYNADRSLVDLDGAGLSGLTAGEVSASSREAINGSQLFGTNERVGYLEEQQRYVMVGTIDSNLPAQAGILGVAIGGDAEARQEGATAVGSYAAALGRNSVAVGRGSYVAAEARDGFALGTRTNVEAVGGMAIGAGSDVMAGAYQSVALGAASVATEADTVSVGAGEYRRRIVSLARGTSDDNATTLIQLREAVGALGGGASIDTTGSVIAPTYTLSGGNFTNVGDALTSIDTKLVSHQDELDTLDTRYKAFVQNDRSIHYNDDRSVVDFGGARLTGVAAGNLSGDSSDAVSGAQLFATNERVGSLEDKQRFVMIGANESGLPAQAGELGVAIGGDADAREVGATAVGSFATAKGRNSVALGRAAYVAPEGRDGFALGTRTRVQAAGGMAIGADSDVIAGADRSVALGNASVATEANTVSVGSGEYRRRIVNVAQGIRANDATTVSQLRGALSALGGGADLDANGNVIGPRYAVQGSEYGSFGDAITALDGSVGDNKRNLDTLDSRFQRLFQESPSANADGAGRLSFGGAQGMVLGNVANGLIGQGSRDAVNGGQLWAVKEDLQGQIDALDPAKGEVSGSPLAMNARSGSITPSADGGSQLAPPEATPPAADPGTVAAQDQLVKAEGDNAVAVGSEGKERQVKHVAEGRADTDAANVRQVNDALERANAYTDSAVASVNQRLDQVDKRINRMAAISSAQSAMAMNTAGLATANRLGAGVGYSEGESAMAVGYQRVLTERGSATFSLNGAFTNSGEKSVGVGVGIGW